MKQRAALLFYDAKCCQHGAYNRADSHHPMTWYPHRLRRDPLLNIINDCNVKNRY